MALERPGLRRTIALTVAVTSVFWVALGAWLFHVHVNADHTRHVPMAAAEQAAEPNRNAFLSGLAGTQPPEPAASAAPADRAGRLTIPVAGMRADMLLDTFTQARASGARSHDAIDIPAPEGTVVLAAAPGRVEKLFLSEEGGNTIYVRSLDGRRIYYYAHLARYAQGLSEGHAVRKGQQLGTVGSTGNASAEAPHLHFAIWAVNPDLGWWQQGTPLNPYPLLGGTSR